jgi:hypothetical protein
MTESGSGSFSPKAWTLSRGRTGPDTVECVVEGLLGIAWWKAVPFLPVPQLLTPYPEFPSVPLFLAAPKVGF